MRYLYNLLISFNVYSLYFIRTYWLNKTNLSSEGLYSSSLSTLSIVHASVVLLLNKYYDWFNWRLVIGILIFYHIAIALIFNKRIEEAVKTFNDGPLRRFYPAFICYLLVGVVSLILLIL